MITHVFCLNAPQEVASTHSLTTFPSSLSVHSFPLHFTSLSFVLVFFVAAVLAVALLLVPPVLGAQVRQLASP